MNTRTRNTLKLGVVASGFLALAACGPSMVRPEGADDARARLTRLQSDPQLANLAPLAVREAESAVRAAEEPRRNDDFARHLVVIADRKVDTAWALAQARFLEDQRKTLSEERERARLDARTREADLARRDANSARTQAELAREDAMSARQTAEMALVDRENATRQADAARTEAELARNEAQSATAQRSVAEQQAEAARLEQERASAQAAAARADADAARREAEELQRQVAELNARETERGLVVTLGDVLFETGKADLKGGAAANLGKLASFLKEYEDRSVIIEGHTDNQGSDDYNLGLSQRRAESVRNFLVAQGVSASRIVASGKGEASPVADNDSATGRQQNRRVEVIIANPPQ